MSPDSYEVLSDKNKGLVLAVSSSVFIGASFIVKKKGLREAGRTGIRAGNVLSFTQAAASRLLPHTGRQQIWTEL